jgi:integrase
MQVVKEAVLWKYHTLKNGEHTVKVRITNFKNVEYITTDMSCHPNNWDEANGLPKPSHPFFSKLVQKITNIKDDIDFELRLSYKNDELISVKELKERVESKLKKAPPLQIKIQKIFEFYDYYIKQLEEQERIGSANMFTSNKSFIQKCIGETDKPFSSITPKDFKKIESAIFKLKSESTKSNYLRTFYRLWNEAIKEKACPEKHHPKTHINYKAYKRIKTKKRAIPAEYIKEIGNLEYPYESRLFRSQKYAIFSYYTRGINFSDMAKLKKGENIKNGYIMYKRSKNKREYYFKLHSKAQEVIEVFENYPMQSDAKYLFPILDKTHDNAKKIDARIDSALKDFNEDLAVFEKAVKSPKHITSYVLRHSFASTLRKKKVPILIIKEAMGHETEEQSNVYLDDIDDSEVTESIEEALD